MKLTNMPEGTTDWSQTPAVAVPGESGVANVQTHQAGDANLRLVEYTAGFLADHWCAKGHVVYVIAGELTIEHQDGRPAYALSAGMNWHVGDDEKPLHRVRSDKGATIFTLD
ncbi:MAG: DHCW motif cupin fold protein [Pyrinomonadaceae bacterium]